MTASLLSSLLWLLAVSAIGCGASERNARGARTDTARGNEPLVAIHGEFLADGSCRATVGGAPLFATRDAPRTALDAGASADVAPPGYALHQIECALGEGDSAQAERADAPSVLVTVYAREGSPVRAGRYTVRANAMSDSGTAAVATRAGIAIFGAASARGAGGASGAGERYLEGRDGTLEITGVDVAHVVARFDVRAAPAWSM